MYCENESTCKKCKYGFTLVNKKCVDSKNYENITKLIYGFSAFVSSINSNDEGHYGFPKQMIHIVKCVHVEGCTFSINYYSIL